MSSGSTSSDADLVARAARGDRRAVLEFVDRFQLQVHGLVAAVLACPAEEAHRVCTEVLVGLLHGAAEDGAGERLVDEVRASALNVALAERRKRSRAASPTARPEPASLREVVHALPDSETVPLVLMDLEGCSLEHVGAMVKVPAREAHARVHRGRAAVCRWVVGADATGRDPFEDDRLSHWLDGTMEPREQQRFGAELRANPGLRAAVSVFERGVRRLRAELRELPGTVSVGEAVLARIRQREAPRQRPPGMQQLRALPLACSVVAGLALAGTALLLDAAGVRPVDLAPLTAVPEGMAPLLAVEVPDPHRGLAGLLTDLGPVDDPVHADRARSLAARLALTEEPVPAGASPGPERRLVRVVGATADVVELGRLLAGPQFPAGLPTVGIPGPALPTDRSALLLSLTTRR